LSEYGMTRCKPISIPLEQNVKLNAYEGDWRTPNSLKDSNVSPSERQRKKEESGRAP
jgi:hypothetical protein